MAKLRFRINLDTIADTGTDLGNMIGAYRVPTVRSTGDWIKNMNEFASHYKTTEAPYTNRRPPAELNSDHSYEMISLTADSFLTGITIDGRSGQAAYQANRSSMPQINLDQCETRSPKWCVTPIGTNSGGGGTPPPILDSIPPNPPQNLKVTQ